MAQVYQLNSLPLAAVHYATLPDLFEENEETVFDVLSTI